MKCSCRFSLQRRPTTDRSSNRRMGCMGMCSIRTMDSTGMLGLPDTRILALSWFSSQSLTSRIATTFSLQIRLTSIHQKSNTNITYDMLFSVPPKR